MHRFFYSLLASRDKVLLGHVSQPNRVYAFDSGRLMPDIVIYPVELALLNNHHGTPGQVRWLELDSFLLCSERQGVPRNCFAAQSVRFR